MRSQQGGASGVMRDYVAPVGREVRREVQRVQSGVQKLAELSPLTLSHDSDASSHANEGENAPETREAELIVAVFRTLVLLGVLVGPRILGLPVTLQVGEIWLAAVAGLYNIVTALGCLLPSRYGLRRPFIVAMDLLLITLWIQLSGHWELRPFYTIVVVVAAMWFRVLGGVVTAAFCNFFFLYIWFRAAAESFSGPILSTTMALNTAMPFLVGALVGYIAESQERERERRLEDQLLIANYQREIDLSAQLQSALVSPAVWRSEAMGARLTPGQSAEVTGATRDDMTSAGTLLPSEAALEVGAAMKSARTLGGGDYFDLIPLGDGRTGVCIADVSGKSVRAQARIPLLKYALRALAPLHPQPAELVERLNATLAPDLQPELYIAFCYVVFDPKRESLTWCNAGHIAPMLLQPRAIGNGTDEEGSTEVRFKRLKTHGPALGMFPDLEYQSLTVEWKPGDNLLFFTDGLTDAFSYRGSEDGEAQLKKLASRLPQQEGRSAREVAQEMLDLASAVLDSETPLERGLGELSRTLRYEDEIEDKRHRDDVTVVLARFVES
jgi:serine phosphatase RsbU (regulator of sigma subunit)